jgi:hypothetical protein
MAEHKGPTSSRLTCTRGGSPVAAMPIYLLHDLRRHWSLRRHCSLRYNMPRISRQQCEQNSQPTTSNPSHINPIRRLVSFFFKTHLTNTILPSSIRSPHFTCSRLWVLIKWKWLWSVSRWCVLLNNTKMHGEQNIKSLQNGLCFLTYQQHFKHNLYLYP